MLLLILFVLRHQAIADVVGNRVQICPTINMTYTNAQAADANQVCSGATTGKTCNQVRCCLCRM
jgi:hypothetical protein